MYIALADEPVLPVPSEALPGKNKKYDSSSELWVRRQEGMRVSPDVKSFKKIQKHVIGGGPLWENAALLVSFINFSKDSGPSSTERQSVRAVNGLQYRGMLCTERREVLKVFSEEHHWRLISRLLGRTVL